MIKYKQGNLLDVKRGVIAHGCNCYGVMGAGVALAVREKYPKAFHDYVKVCNRYYDNPQDLLGEVNLVRVSDDILIANCFTQLDFGGRKRHVDYSAVARCFEKLASADLEELHIPKIGAGLAGGDWKVLENLIISSYPGDITCWILEDIQEEDQQGLYNRGNDSKAQDRTGLL